jgi:hypothetical protein
MKIVLLVGHKRVGKDTCANELIKRGWVQFSFAQFLKKALQPLFGWTDETFNDENKEKIDETWSITPRKMCQELGTEFLRDYCSKFLDLSIVIKDKPVNVTFHIKRLHQEISKLDSNANIIISDGRFQDEIDYVKMMGGTVIKIERENIHNEFSNHKSETGIDNLINIDYVLLNNGTKDELIDKFNQLFN